GVRPARPRGFSGQRACLSPQTYRSGAVVSCDRTLEQALLSFSGKGKGAREHSARDWRGAEDAPQNRLPEKRTRPACAFGTNPLVRGAGWHRACDNGERFIL